MDMVNIHEAKTHLSKLLERVEKGEQIIIARAGKPIAKLMSYGAEPRKGGFMRGMIDLPDDWDSPEVNEEVARLFNDSIDPYLDFPDRDEKAV